jgi:hypothetical protein
VFQEFLVTPKAVTLGRFSALRVWATELGSIGTRKLPMLLLALVPTKNVLSIKLLSTIRACKISRLGRPDEWMLA